MEKDGERILIVRTSLFDEQIEDMARQWSKGNPDLLDIAIAV